jgi:uncharacterized protein (DUF433 family)
MDNFQYFERGIYSIPEAARLTGLDTRSISRWIRGYSYVKSGSRKESAPLFEADYSPSEGRFALSFLDMMELRFVHAFKTHGLSLHKIRIASNRAAELIGKHHPFATSRFFTDRKTIFARIVLERPNTELLDLLKGQYAIDKILSPLLVEGVVFEKDYPSRWYPLRKNHSIVVDPRFSFGQPIVTAHSIPTAVLAAAFRAEGSIKKVAQWYEVDETVVKAAINFEARLAA